MASEIIKILPNVPAWLQALGEPTAQRLLAWAQVQTEASLTDVFGYHAVQAGWPGFDALQANRMPHRWQAQQEFDVAHPGPDLSFDSRAWPWAAESLDLVVLPHTLERSADPHACLREVERVLIAEGHVCIIGLNPWSLWGWRLQRHRAQNVAHDQALPPVQPIAPYRVRDWLQLLGFEVQWQRCAGWTPAWRSERWVQRWSWLETVGQRFPFVGGVYLIVASKRVPGGRLHSGPVWRKRAPRPAMAVPAASAQSNRAPHAHTTDPNESLL